MRLQSLPSRTRRGLVTLALAVALATLVTAQAAAARGGAQVMVAKNALGSILVNAHGMTLYMFAADKGGKSVCYGECAKFWPPLLTAAKPVAGVGVNASLLGTTTRTGGKLQVTYHGRPLYLFVKDTKPGQATGQGVNAAGGLWWVMSPSGAVIRHAAAAKKPAAAPAPAAGGYHYNNG